MARISLRAYQRDIEAMIDKNQLDEAFAHCRYILKNYPKNVDTYRLMGKALLEAQRFSDAADVFHRVLSSVPDDFIAHLGLSIIREDESNLDAAIWHMERSFEVQPSNAAVQVELRRLYGLRDGVTPQKIHLTRGALARMSAKSNLYSQAISELRAALSNDPQRPDLQVVLAEMYLLTGARMEAIESCNSLINKLPFCLVANRILADLLPETERADQAQEYRSRLGELDPYYLQISPVSPAIDQVPDGAVTIERLDYSEGAEEEVKQAQPAWATSLGVDLDEAQEEPDEPTPEWLEDSQEETQVPPAEMETSGPQAEESPEVEGEFAEADEIPDWMKAEGEPEEAQPHDVDASMVAAGAAAAAAGAILSGQDEDQESEQAAAEEIPQPEEEEPLPEWMSEVEEPSVEQLPEEHIPPEPVADEELETIPADSELEQGKPFEAEEEEEIPDWMVASEQPAAEETPDWLVEAMEGSSEEDLQAEQIPTSPEDEAGIEIEAQEQDEPSEGELAGAGVEIAAAALAGAVLAGEEDQPAEEFETEELFEGDLSGELPEVELAEQPEEEVPSWLQELGEGLPEGETVAAASVFQDQGEDDLAAPAGELEAEEHPSEDQFEETAEGALAEASLEEIPQGEYPESIPDWLSEVSPEELPEEGPVYDEQLDIVKAEIPVWLKKMEAQHKVELEGAGEIEGVEELEMEGELTSLTGEDVPSWLLTAMEPGLQEGVERPEAVEDISQVFPELEEQALAAAEFEGVPPGEEMEAVMEGEAPGEELEPVVEGEAPGEELEAVMEGEAPGEELEVVVEGEAPGEELEAVMEGEVPEEELEAELISTVGEAESDTRLDVAEPAEEMPEIEAEAAAEAEPLAEVEEIPVEEEAAVEEPEAGVAPAVLAAAVAAEHLFEDEETQPIAVAEEPKVPPGEIEEPAVMEAEEELPAEAGEEGVLVEEAGEVALVEEAEEVLAVEGEAEALVEEVEAETIVEEGEIAEAAEEIEAEMPSEEEIEPLEAVPPLADQPLSTEDEEAAMAWLESLAAKQGAAEEELLTEADERQEEPPQWVLEAGDEGEITEELAAEEPQISAAAAAGMAGAILAGEELLSTEDEGELGDEAPSEWVPEVEPEAEVEMAPTSQAEEPAPEGIETEVEPEFIDELAAAADLDLEGVEAEEAPPEIPDWLSGIADEEQFEPAQPAEWTPEMLAEEAQEIQAEAVPEEKLDLNAASLAQLERIPGIGFITAQNIITYRADSGPFTSLEQLENVEGLTPDLIADLDQYLTVAMVAEGIPTEFELPELQQAWDSLNVGNIDQALEQYSEYIKRDQHLDQIIRDLQAGLAKYPQDSSLYQSLGDAYMHANLLQEALDAYNRAEDLIS